MVRRRIGHDAACYYGGKLMGRCTRAEADEYVEFMKSCGGSAARVLREYAYFSPELRGILEKVAAVQEKEQRATGVFRPPTLSPWGDVQHSDTLCPGVFLVSTASHGGTMVAQEMAAVLSPAARKCGFKMGGYLCYGLVPGAGSHRQGYPVRRGGGRMVYSGGQRGNGAGEDGVCRKIPGSRL